MENIIRALMDLIAYEVGDRTVEKSQYSLTDEDQGKIPEADNARGLQI